MRHLGDLGLTDHAAARMQQRGIRAHALEALLDYGRIAHADRDRDIVYFDKKARARLKKLGGDAAHEAERLSRTYAILGSDGLVVTVGHRYRRINRR